MAVDHVPEPSSGSPEDAALARFQAALAASEMALDAEPDKRIEALSRSLPELTAAAKAVAEHG